VLATPPAAAFFKQATGGVFPVFKVSHETMLLQAACALVVALAAAIVPAVQASRVRIVEGLRAIG
jgi:putative ABC transport system permease protein